MVGDYLYMLTQVLILIAEGLNEKSLTFLQGF
jgi:hypothetical protein